MFDEKIDNLHAPEISLQILFALGLQKIAQQRRGTGPLSNRFQQLGSWLRDAVVAQQSFPERRCSALWPGNLFAACKTQRANDLIHQFRIVCGVDAHRIADFKT